MLSRPFAPVFRTLTRALGATILLLAAGCSGGGGGGGFEATLTGSGTEIFTGETLTVTISLDRPVGGAGLEVDLRSSNELVLDVPTSVTFAAGESVKTISVQGGVPGGPVVVSALLGEPPPEILVTVAPPPTITLVAITGTADQFSTGTFSFLGTATHQRAIHPTNLTVEAPIGSGITLGLPVLSGNATEFSIAVPFEVAVDAVPGPVALMIDGNGPGLVGADTSQDVTVKQIPRVAAFDPATVTLDATETRPFLVVLDLPARTGGELVTLAATDTTKLGVPANVTVPAGQMSASVDVLAKIVSGATTMSGQLADAQTVGTVTIVSPVVNAPVATNDAGYQGETKAFSATGSASSYVAINPATFTLTAPAGSGLTVMNEALSGNATSWTLSANVVVDAAAVAGTVMLAFDGNGAAGPGAMRSIPFTVRALPVVLTVGPDGTTVNAGSTATMTVVLNAPARPGGEVVALVSSSASVAVPSSMTVAAGTSSGTFAATGVSEGPSTVTASLNGGSDTTVVTGALVELGNVIVSELTVLTVDTSGASNVGERIELHNVTAGALAINGWWLETASAGPLTFRSVSTPGDSTTAVTVTAGGFAFGVPNPANPLDIPAGAAFVYGVPGTTATLADAGDRLRVKQSVSQLQDVVDFTAFVTNGATALGASSFPGTRAHSTYLGSASQSGTANDDGGNWCTTFGATDTHGAANAACDASAVVINEILYNAAGATDQGFTFVELAGPGGAVLGSMKVRPVNQLGDHVGGQASAKLQTIAVGTRMPADGFFVVADLNAATNGVTFVPNADLAVVSMDPEGGPGDVMQLLSASGALRDVVMWGASQDADNLANDGTAMREGSTSAPTTVAGSSIGRTSTSADTDVNGTDWTTDATPTPGEPNL